MSKSDGPKSVFTVKSAWAGTGEVMPSIISGSTENNKRVLAETERAARIDGRVLSDIQVTQTPAPITSKFDETKQMLEKANAAIASLLHCDEKLESPQSSPEKKAAPSIVNQSPFSQAKAKGSKVGLRIDEACRGVYTQEELAEKIESFAKVKRTKLFE